jgi:hypothetical protein
LLDLMCEARALEDETTRTWSELSIWAEAREWLMPSPRPPREWLEAQRWLRRRGEQVCRRCQAPVAEEQVLDVYQERFRWRSGVVA